MNSAQMHTRMTPCHPDTWHPVVGGNAVSCNLCPHECQIEEGGTGLCRNRANIDGHLVVTNHGWMYGPVLGWIQDHGFRALPDYPPDFRRDHGTFNAVAIGSSGCNLRCPFCNKHELSQTGNVDQTLFREATPERIMESVERHHCSFVCFDINEPVVNWEFILDVADHVRARGVRVAVRTAGYLNELHHDTLLDRTDLLAIDIKPMTDDYLSRCGIHDPSVPFRLLRRAIERGVHTEVSHLVIQGGMMFPDEPFEGVNDNEQAMGRFCGEVRAIDPAIPVHLIPHRPAWRSDYPATTHENMEKWRRYLEWRGLTTVFVHCD